MTPTRRHAVLAAAVCALAVLGAASAAGPPTGGVSDDSYSSRAVGGRLPFRIYLPPEYDSSRRRYPVLYFLHGLPAGANAYRSTAAWLVPALEQAGLSAIVVMPRGARGTDPDPEYLNWGPGRNWANALAVELPEFVDAHYRTIANRGGRALIGLSAGGYGAVNLALHHLDSFSVVESWSGYFHPTDPAGTGALDLGSARANRLASAHSFVQALHRWIRHRPTFLAFYVGRGDTRFRSENELLDRELRSAGVPHVFQVYPGAHEQTVWSAHAPGWLALALGHLAPRN